MGLLFLLLFVPPAEAASPEARLQQTIGWVTDCTPVRAPVAKAKQTFYRFQDDRGFQRLEVYYVDSKCRESSYLVTAEGKANLGKAKGMKLPLSLEYESVTLTIQALEAETVFNETRHCGVQGWEFGGTRNVAGLCGFPAVKNIVRKTASFDGTQMKIEGEPHPFRAGPPDCRCGV